MNCIDVIFMGFLLFPELLPSGQCDLFTNTEPPGAISSITLSINTEPEIVMQIGAFRLESNALAFRDKLSVILDNTVTVISENGYFKVRLTGISDAEEAEKVITVLGMAGINNIWILPAKKPEEVRDTISVQPDTTARNFKVNIVNPPAIDEKPVSEQPIIALQVGVFHDKSRAQRMQKRIYDKLNLHVEVVQEYDYYKVIITGFSTVEDAYKSYPGLEELGYPDISLIKTYSRKR